MGRHTSHILTVISDQPRVKQEVNNGAHSMTQTYDSSSKYSSTEKGSEKEPLVDEVSDMKYSWYLL